MKRFCLACALSFAALPALAQVGQGYIQITIPDPAKDADMLSIDTSGPETHMLLLQLLHDLAQLRAIQAQQMAAKP
jgi:hypothetical protein